PPFAPPFPYTTLFRSIRGPTLLSGLPDRLCWRSRAALLHPWNRSLACRLLAFVASFQPRCAGVCEKEPRAREPPVASAGINLAEDRKSTRLNSSHQII